MLNYSKTETSPNNSWGKEEIKTEIARLEDWDLEDSWFHFLGEAPRLKLQKKRK